MKVRADLIPEPSDKTYQLHHVYVVDETSQAWLRGYKGKLDSEGSPVNLVDYDAWVATLPHIWRVNPCLCHFIVVPETVQLVDLEAFIPKLFTPDALATLDNYLVLPDSLHYVSPFMRNKPALERIPIQTKDTADLISSVNALLTNKQVDLKAGGKIIEIEPQSIDVGAAAINRAYGAGNDKSTLAVENPSNGNGTIDTVQLWAASILYGTVKVGTAFLVSGTTYQCRDTEPLGTQGSGSKKTITGLSIDIVTNDYIGIYYSTGLLELGWPGGSGYYTVTGDYLTATTQASYTFGSGYTISLYGTGTEAGGGQEITGTPVQAASSVQAPVVGGTGSAPISPNPVAALSAILAPSIAASGSTPITLNPVAVVASVNPPTVSTPGGQSVAPDPLSVSSGIQEPVVGGTGAAPIDLVALGVVSSIQAPAINATGSAPVSPSPVAVLSAVQAPSLAGSGSAAILPASLATTSRVVNPSISNGGGVSSLGYGTIVN